ncbi:ATP-dependent DNA helicase PIF1 [Fusarium oxysporum f. sp. albedinis]|nr:ATP-dependent DNA helicase PIF1 [Fusarium oxysporum f. sp. albedinis]
MERIVNGRWRSQSSFVNCSSVFSFLSSGTCVNSHTYMQETTVAGAIRKRSKTIICSLKRAVTFLLWRESSPPLLFDPGFSAILVSGIRTPS